jgi:hypothetical protein
MKHGTVILIVLLLVFTAGACGGDGQSNDAPPWGLDGVDMPDTEAQVAAVFAALPEEIVGRTRLGDEPTHFGYIDEGSGSFWTIQADPWELQQALHMPGVDSPADWVTFLASGRSAVVVEASAVDPVGDLMWVATNVPSQEHMLDFWWAAPDGSWLFFVEGDSVGRQALVEAFVTAAGE